VSSSSFFVLVHPYQVSPVWAKLYPLRQLCVVCASFASSSVMAIQKSREAWDGPRSEGACIVA
jgi:hypothetical protein